VINFAWNKTTEAQRHRDSENRVDEMSAVRQDHKLDFVGQHSTWRRVLSPTGNTGDAIFRIVMFLAALLMVATVVAMVIALATDSLASVRQFGFGFLTSQRWDPVKGEFGALPFIYGTIVSSLIALLISVPFSLGIAIFLVEQAPHYISRPVGFLVELLAAIPSVVYGLWGIFVLAPFLRNYIEPPLAKVLGWLPLFKGSITGIGLLTGGIILAIMVTPIISAVVRDVLAAVPGSQREAALALGATKWEMIKGVVFPHSFGGMVGAVMLGLGRAIGETIAVALVIGAAVQISPNLFSAGDALPSIIVRNWGESSGTFQAALVGCAVTLFLITIIINYLARIVVSRAEARLKGAAA